MMSMFGTGDGPKSYLEDTRARLESAGSLSDQERLALLDELYRSLERELEGDLDQPGSPRL